MTQLITGPNLSDPDVVFDLLSSLHEGLDIEASLRAYGRLVLLLANHIGDVAIIREAIAVARSHDAPVAPS